MSPRVWIALSCTAAALVFTALWSHLPACCPAPPSGRAVVNADQTVVILWDAAAKTQHFIRQASFKSEADDFGFLVPSPSRPELDESGSDAFPFLAQLTAPEIQRVGRPSPGMSCACSASAPTVKSALPDAVRVLEQKQVAGFAATVLEADSSKVLVDWLQENGFAFSPEVEAWAKPYVEQRWKFTALKVAKEKAEGESSPDVAAAALRISFQTERPLFPYREPDSQKSAATLGASQRLLRIYFLGDARYDGELTKEQPWTGKVTWAGKLTGDSRKRALDLLKLPETTGPAEYWLTEFEDSWPYQPAPADLYFAPSAKQDSVKRPPIIQYVSSPLPNDITAYAAAAVVVLPLFRRRKKKDVA